MWHNLPGLQLNDFGKQTQSPSYDLEVSGKNVCFHCRSIYTAVGLAVGILAFNPIGSIYNRDLPLFIYFLVTQEGNNCCTALINIYNQITMWKQ